MDHIDLVPLIMGLVGGLALFLFGLDLMTNALKSLAGSGMSSVLAKLTGNRFLGAATGAFATAAVQSSSVTTVLVVGFISAGLMTLPQSIGVIMGANIGSTVTAQIIAFQVMKYALVFVAVGFAGTLFTRRSVFNTYGSVLIGLGMIFLGMGFMSEATDPLRSYQPFVDAMGHMDIAVNQVAIGRERLQQRIAFSEETQDKAAALHKEVHSAYRLAIRSLEEPELARRVIDMKREIRALFDQAVEHLAGRLQSSEPNRTVLYRLETQTLECLHREYYFAKRIAKAIAPQVDPSAETGMFEVVRD